MSSKRRPNFSNFLTMKLLKDDLKTRLKQCNLQIDEEKEEKMNSLTERYIKAMIWNIDERFPSDVLQIIGAFSIFDFSVYACNELEFLCKHFLAITTRRKLHLSKSVAISNLN